MAVRKTYVIEVDPTSGDRIEYEYDYSDRIWNVYAIDGFSGYPIESGYAGCRSELMWMIDNEVYGWFDDEQARADARRAYELWGDRAY